MSIDAELTAANLLTTLQQRFGFPAFRPGQLAAIERLLSARRLLCVHPTGFGKSLLYQLPATLLPGLTLVISPLLALMRDQEQQLARRFKVEAASINSDQDEATNTEIRRRVKAGAIKILFVAPEQLDHLGRFAELVALPIDLLVIDEAHCISTWGHDFRPSYRQILTLVRALTKARPQVRLLGLTATANARTEADIQQQLSDCGEPVAVLRESLSRPNIALSLAPAIGMPAKMHACLQAVQQLDGCGLIYCATRENVMLLAKYLAAQGLASAGYHAGHDPEVKRQLQADFITDRYQVLVATNALGMGIDKANLRYIIHFDVPGSITAYYQEIGRCGRDGLPAQALLLYDGADFRIQQHFIDSAQPQAEDFAQLQEAVRHAAEPPNLTTLRRQTGLHPTRVTVVVAELVAQGFMRKQVHGRAQVYLLETPSHDLDLSRYTAQRSAKLAEMAAMRAYAETAAGCRMARLRLALGDAEAAPCGNCDLCAASTLCLKTDAAATTAAADWLARESVPIAASRAQRLDEGIALLDGKLRAPLFVHFMRGRAQASPAGAGSTGLPEALWRLLLAQVQALVAEQPLAAILVLPSQTWAGRSALVAALRDAQTAPILDDLLHWQTPPLQRQGTLLNNDQRHHNVHQQMGASGPLPATPAGQLLLLDDYVGSGHTLREAARVVRRTLGHTGPLRPLTLAAVRWRLGAAGMI